MSVLMPIRLHTLAAAVMAVAALQTTAQAASIELSPAEATVPLSAGTVAFDLMMDFGTAEPTLGGGIDIDLQGPITLAGFTPSAWFTSASGPDQAFSGHGSALADADYEVHIGHFNGLSGRHSLGTLQLNLLSSGLAGVKLATNSIWGEFYGINSQPQAVQFKGASIQVTAVPEPATLAMWLLGGGMLAAGGALRRRQLHAGR